MAEFAVGDLAGLAPLACHLPISIGTFTLGSLLVELIAILALEAHSIVILATDCAVVSTGLAPAITIGTLSRGADTVPRRGHNKGSQAHALSLGGADDFGKVLLAGVAAIDQGIITGGAVLGEAGSTAHVLSGPRTNRADTLGSIVSHASSLETLGAGEVVGVPTGLAVGDVAGGASSDLVVALAGGTRAFAQTVEEEGGLTDALVSEFGLDVRKVGFANLAARGSRTRARGAVQHQAQATPAVGHRS